MGGLRLGGLPATLGERRAAIAEACAEEGPLTQLPEPVPETVPEPFDPATASRIAATG